MNNTAAPVYPQSCSRALSSALRAFAHLRTTTSPELRKPLIEAFTHHTNFIARKTSRTPAQVQREVKRLQKEFGFILPCRSEVAISYVRRAAK